MYLNWCNYPKHKGKGKTMISLKDMQKHTLIKLTKENANVYDILDLETSFILGMKLKKILLKHDCP